MADPSKPSPVETIKAGSQFLRGEIPEELASDTDHFGKESIQLLKHHGTYQQDDRDQRSAAKADGRGKAYMMMVRARIPGGKLTSEQLLAQIDLGDQLGNQTIRLTTRQAIQFHGILKHNLKETIARINAVQLSTLGACGDVNRNVMCCPAPYKDSVRDEMQQLARVVTDHLAPRTPAYHQIWLREEGEEEKVEIVGPPEAIEPIYRDIYLPRKFKIGIALPEDNCIDVYTHDVGLLVVREGQTIHGYNVLVGGGFGVTPSAKATFPCLAKRLCFATPDEVLDVVTAVVKVQRDFGNRSNRKVARLKYLVADWGIEKFKAKVEEYLGRALPSPTPDDVTGVNDHMGWDQQGDGRLFYGLNVENGRIHDVEGGMQLRSALREICTTLSPSIHLTAHQSIIFGDVAPENRSRLEEILKRHEVPMTEDVSTTRRWSMACVAWPTCGLAITESERALPGIVDELEREVAALGLSEEVYTLRMTGCPNGCARPYNADIGLVGKAKGKYTVFLGGTHRGTRLNFIYKDMVPAEELVAELQAVFACFKGSRQPNETLGDFCDRLGKDALLAATAEALT